MSRGYGYSFVQQAKWAWALCGVMVAVVLVVTGIVELVKWLS